MNPCHTIVIQPTFNHYGIVTVLAGVWTFVEMSSAEEDFPPVVLSDPSQGGCLSTQLSV